MKRRHTLWPRRKKALVWGGLAAILFVLLMLTHKICLTPTQAIRAAEAETGTGKTEVVMTLSYQDVPLYLTRNDKALLLVPFTHKLDMLGLRYAAFADCTLDPGPVQAAGTVFTSETEQTFLLVGYTDLPDAASIYARDIRSRDFGDVPLSEISASVFQSGPEKGYFWGILSVPLGDNYITPTDLRVLDANGTILATYDMINNWEGVFQYEP